MHCWSESVNCVSAATPSHVEESHVEELQEVTKCFRLNHSYRATTPSTAVRRCSRPRVAGYCDSLPFSPRRLVSASSISFCDTPIPMSFAFSRSTSRTSELACARRSVASAFCCLFTIARHDRRGATARAKQSLAADASPRPHGSYSDAPGLQDIHLQLLGKRQALLDAL